VRARTATVGVLLVAACGAGAVLAVGDEPRTLAKPAAPPTPVTPPRPEPPPDPLLAFAEAPRRPGNLLARFDVVGRSGEGRPIELEQWGDPSWPGELLVFGCVHGDECGASALRPLTDGCPDPSADILVVPNLNPDGAVAESRLNGRGVDLNRNFPSGWRSIGDRWDPQYSGPRPFSEREARLAARIVAALEPEATIWFHQHHGSRPFVRAWGQSEPLGGEFARLAQMPFRSLPWPAGTAPNWQNHRFPGSSSFVVELPRGKLEPAMKSRLAKAVLRLGRQVRED
jgi:murein peptide amidase A